MTETTWRLVAACRGMDPDRFAPWGIEDVDLEALATCQGCPVAEQCAAWAEHTGSAQWVIHGGRLPTAWAFRAARVVECRHCARPLVIGARAHADDHYCNNRCRFRARAVDERAAHGEFSLFELLAEVSA